MNNANPQPITTGICDSCGANAPLIPTKHHQAGNPHVWMYCERCRFAHDKEVKVNAALLQMHQAGQTEQANDPAVAAQLHAQAEQELINAKAQAMVDAQNADNIQATPPATEKEVIDADIIDEAAETPETNTTDTSSSAE